MTRPMTAGTLPTDRSESGGFILVGVVMFMLALTILGLSLFSLSSYEGQFFYSSVSREQSLHNSESGMELVKALLSARDARLEHAQFAVGQFGITRVLAYQSTGPNPSDTTSRGPVNWNKELVLLVSGRAGSEVRTVESRFTPSETKNPYRNLVTCGLGFQYDNSNGGSQTVWMNGRVWQHIQWPSDAAWTSAVRWENGAPIDSTTPPVPLADDFVDANLPGATDLTGAVQVGGSGGSGNSYSLRISNTTGAPRFYTLSTPHEVAERSSDPELNWYGCFFDGRLTLSVKGTCVLVVPDGACFAREVTIVPDGNGATGSLVIVAKANQDQRGHENRGIWFEGALIHQNSNIKVFLVSQGDVAITHDHNSGNPHETRALSVVCGGDFELMGPSASQVFKMYYGSGAANQDATADALLAAGALPPLAGGSGGGFAYLASSWKETRLP